MRHLQGYLLTFIMAGCLFVASAATAVFVEDRLQDTAQELRAREIAKGIRCLVCQNQSIMDSNADLAKDLRGVVRERVLAGDTDDQVRQYLVDRYGDWVLLNPPFKLGTVILWVGPLVLFVGGGFAMVSLLRRKNITNTASTDVSPLSDEEQAEFASLIDQAGGDKK
ncbi:MAG: cytochrome c-type biogenesis protein [Sneathiella sp.]